jgi:hypothetical protein
MQVGGSVTSVNYVARVRWWWWEPVGQKKCDAAGFQSTVSPCPPKGLDAWMLKWKGTRGEEPEEQVMEIVTGCSFPFG